MNNLIFVRKLKYLELLYLIIYKLYSICILFLIKGSTDALSSDNSFCDCTYNDLGLNELLLTSETQYHLLVIGGVEELPGPSSAKSAKGTPSLPFPLTIPSLPLQITKIFLTTYL